MLKPFLIDQKTDSCFSQESETIQQQEKNIKKQEEEPDFRPLFLDFLARHKL